MNLECQFILLLVLEHVGTFVKVFEVRIDEAEKFFEAEVVVAGGPVVLALVVFLVVFLH